MLLHLFQMLRLALGEIWLGLNELHAMTAPAARRYIIAVVQFGIVGFAIPLILATLALLGHMVTAGPVRLLHYFEWQGIGFWTVVIDSLNLFGGLWTFIIAGSGILSVMAGVAFFAFAAPAGALINAAFPTVGGHERASHVPQQATWGYLISPAWIVEEIRSLRKGLANGYRAGVAQYITQVWVCLLFLGATYFLIGISPSLRAVSPLLILGAMLLAMLGRFGNRMARLGQVIIMVSMMGLVLVRWGCTPEAAIKDSQRFVDWVTDSYQTKRFWVTVICALLFGSLILAFFRWLFHTVQNRTVAVSVSSSGSKETANRFGRLGEVLMWALAIGVILFIGTQISGCHASHKANVAAEMELQLARERTRQAERDAEAAAKIAALEKRAASLSVTVRTATDNEWTVSNPVVSPVTLSTNWSRKIRRPYGHSANVRPKGLDAEVLLITPHSTNTWIRGERFGREVEHLQYRLTNRTDAVQARIGVGKPGTLTAGH